MAIPLQSLSGTEVLRRGGINDQSTAETWFNLDGTSPSTTSTSGAVPTNHIITMLSIILCEKSNATRTFTLYAHDGTTQANIIEAQSVGAYETFVFSDKFVLIGGDNLKINCSASSNFQINYMYIDTNWEN